MRGLRGGAAEMVWGRRNRDGHALITARGPTSPDKRPPCLSSTIVIMSTDIHLAETSDTSPKVKPKPSKSKVPVPFAYYESDDGTDENLLIILHGLGM